MTTPPRDETMTLEPCPFCGEGMLMKERAAFHPTATVGKEWCWLTTAGEFGGPYELDESDYAAWNRRHRTASSHQETGWRTIDSAPKDGTEVDLWCINREGLSAGGRRVPDCHYHCDEWLQWSGEPEIGWLKIKNAAYWMPLPEPPK